jgi:hypothetical protein
MMNGELQALVATPCPKRAGRYFDSGARCEGGNRRRSSRLSVHLRGGSDEKCDYGDVNWSLRRLLEPDSDQPSIAPYHRKAPVHHARRFEGHHRAQTIR